MSHTNTAIRINENTAVSVDQRPKLRVIEGGLSQSKKCNHVRAFALPTVRELAIAAVMVALVAAFFFACSAQDAQAHSRVDDMLASAQYETVTVVSGDTLWGIAEDHSVDGVTTANMVDVIREANHLESACLHGGMQLLVPTI